MADEDVKIVGLSSSKSKGKTNWKIAGALIGVVVLALGVLAGILLVKQQQDLREKASNDNFCPAAEACPGSDGVLRNCHPPAADGGPTASLCNQAGRIEFCGTRNYCCPQAGGNWTTNLSLCPNATSTPTVVASASATPTSAARIATGATATATATAASQCNTSCTLDSQCPSGLICNITSGSSGFCRNSQCISDSDCVCTTATPIATATSTGLRTSTPTSSAIASNVPTSTATAFPVPTTGASLPTIIGSALGVIMIIASLVLVF